MDDPALTEQGLTLADSVITQLWQTPTNGYEFNTPFLYSSQNPSSWIYPSFENNLAVWQLIDVLNRLDNTVLPKISGDPHSGKKLTASPGTWTPGHTGKIRFSYQWLLDGKPIAGATGEKYSVRRSDTGHEISVQVTARQNNEGTAVATSAALLVR